MKTNVFLDANTLIYFLDASSGKHRTTVKSLEKLLVQGSQFFTSHHVVEEVLFIVSKLTNDQTALTTAVKDIGQIPNLQFIEPQANSGFAIRYVKLRQKTGLGVNDSLLLQLMIDSGINHLFSYDKKLLAEAAKQGIETLEK